MKIFPLLASMLAASLGYCLFNYFAHGANGECGVAALFGAGLGFLTWSLNNDLQSIVSPSLRHSVLLSAVSLSVFWIGVAVFTMLYMHQIMSLRSFGEPGLLFFGIGALSGAANYLASQAIKKWKLKVATTSE